MGENDSACVSDDVDKDFLIGEIEMRPVLWDKTSILFSDRNAKKRAWEEVCRIVNPNYEQVSGSEQALFIKNVESKWRNLRDAFIKSQKQDQSKFGGKAKRRKKYVYEDQMQFLINGRDPKKTRPVVPQTKSVNVETGTKQFTPSGKLEETVLHYLDREKFKRETLDDHQHFFNSLLPLVRKFDEDQVMEFRLEVMNAVQKIRRTPQHCIPNTYDRSSPLASPRSNYSGHSSSWTNNYREFQRHSSSVEELLVAKIDPDI